MKQIYQKEGFTALYRGMGASLIGVSNPIVFFPVYESMKFYFKKAYDWTFLLVDTFFPNRKRK